MNKKVSFAHFQNWTGNRPFWLKAVILGEYVLWEHSIWEFSRRSTNVSECRAAMLVSREVVRRGWLHRGCFKQESCIPPVTGKKKSLNIASQSGDLWLSWLLIASLVGSSTVETMKSIRIISLLPIHQIFFCASLRWKSGCIPKTATILSHIYFSFTIVCVWDIFLSCSVVHLFGPTDISALSTPICSCRRAAAKSSLQFIMAKWAFFSFECLKRDTRHATRAAHANRIDYIWKRRTHIRRNRSIRQISDAKLLNRFVYASWCGHSQASDFDRFSYLLWKRGVWEPFGHYWQLVFFFHSVFQ